MELLQPSFQWYNLNPNYNMKLHPGCVCRCIVAKQRLMSRVAPSCFEILKLRKMLFASKKAEHSWFFVASLHMPGN